MVNTCLMHVSGIHVSFEGTGIDLLRKPASGRVETWMQQCRYGKDKAYNCRRYVRLLFILLREPDMLLGIDALAHLCPVCFMDFYLSDLIFALWKESELYWVGGEWCFGQGIYGYLRFHFSGMMGIISSHCLKPSLEVEIPAFRPPPLRSGEEERCAFHG